MQYLLYLLAAVIGYLLGNVSTGVLTAKYLANIDIREYGSGSAGTTNVLRTLGWLPSVLTLVGDTLKGALGALIGLWIGGVNGMLIGGLFAVIGHNWPVLLNFRGGKGIATTFGAALVIHPPAALILFAVFLIIVATLRYVSVASIVAVMPFPIVTIILYREDAYFWPRMAAAILLFALCVFSHRENIVRLIRGNENRLDFAKITQISKKRGKKK